MKKIFVAKLAIALVAVSMMLTGCIGTAGQYRGAASGVELKQTTADGVETTINVSGLASAKVDPKTGEITILSQVDNLAMIGGVAKLFVP